MPLVCGLATDLRPIVLSARPGGRNMRFLLGLALLAALAGCLHSPAPAPAAPQSQAQETEVDLRVDIVDSTPSAPFCVADFCGNVNPSFLLLPLEENQTLTGFDLT